MSKELTALLDALTQRVESQGVRLDAQAETIETLRRELATEKGRTTRLQGRVENLESE